jgi:hypothetical protein
VCNAATASEKPLVNTYRCGKGRGTCMASTATHTQNGTSTPILKKEEAVAVGVVGKPKDSSGSDDPYEVKLDETEDPEFFPLFKKWFIVVLISFSALTVTCCSSLVSGSSSTNNLLIMMVDLCRQPSLKRALPKSSTSRKRFPSSPSACMLKAWVSVLC